MNKDKFYKENADFAPRFHDVERVRRKPGLETRPPDRTLTEGRIVAAIWENLEPRIVFAGYHQERAGDWKKSWSFYKEDLEDLARLCRKVRGLYGV